MKKDKVATAAEGDALFAPIAAAFAGDRAVTQGKMFGSPGLKVRGKVFAIVVKGRLVVKLPNDRVNALVASGRAEYFDPGHGRLMKEWVAVASAAQASWLGLATEARDFVSRG